MNILTNIIITGLVVFASVFGIYNYVPLSWLGDTPVGATVTTILATDKIRDSRAVINTNFANLNLNKIEISTTTLPLLTTLSGLTSATSLASVGTITTGTWNADTLGVAYGGTGSTTLASNQLLIGNGTSLGVVSGLGASGQFLTSNGPASAPTWQASSINQADNYNWTGVHTFAGLTTFNTATTTFNATSTFNSFVGIATTTDDMIKSGLSVDDDMFISGGLGIGVKNTTNGSLIVSGEASTTDLVISGTQTGGTFTYISSSAFSVNAGNTNYAEPTGANFAIVKYNNTIGTASYDSDGAFTIAKVGATIIVWHDGVYTQETGKFTINWTGTNINIAETTDGGSTFSGTIYWYK